MGFPVFTGKSVYETGENRGVSTVLFHMVQAGGEKMGINGLHRRQVGLDPGMGVDVFMVEVFKGHQSLENIRAEPHMGGLHAGGDKIRDQVKDNGAVGIAQQSGTYAGQVAALHQLQADGIFKVPADVGDDVGHADHASLEGHGQLIRFFRGPHPFKGGIEVFERFLSQGLDGPLKKLPVVTEYPIQGLQGEVPSFSLAFNLLQELDGLDIVVEKTGPMLPSQPGQYPFPIVPKGRMADVVPQADGFDEIFVEPQIAADGAGDAGDQLDMEHPVGEVIVFDQGKNLGFVDVPGIGLGVEDAVGIHGKCLAVIRGMAGGPWPAPDSRVAECGQGGPMGMFPLVKARFHPFHRCFHGTESLKFRSDGQMARKAPADRCRLAAVCRDRMRGVRAVL